MLATDESDRISEIRKELYNKQLGYVLDLEESESGRWLAALRTKDIRRSNRVGTAKSASGATAEEAATTALTWAREHPAKL
jgi:hypothetical protein